MVFFFNVDHAVWVSPQGETEWLAGNSPLTSPSMGKAGAARVQVRGSVVKADTVTETAN